MSLEKLFQQIYESEQTAESRREQISQLKKQISDSEAELKTLQESCTSSRGRLQIFVRQFHEEKAAYSVLLEQKKALESRKEGILDEIDSLKILKAEKQQKLKEIRSDYSKTVRDFCANFDLTGDGVEKRRQAQLQELQNLKDELNARQKVLDDCKAEEERALELMEQRALLMAEISQLQSQIIEVDSTLDKKRQEASEAAKKAEEYRCEILKDSELLQLQKEFDSVKNERRDLEQKVRSLKGELERAKRQNWHGNNRNSPKGYKFHPMNRTANPR